ncbi:hypothetical protein LN050_04390 [Comamonadaceae bacterium M7527]|nr:hypothetical protein LN050_04390 [Comamonadaceae bacterium M7527]
MAIGWLSALKLVPWSDVIEATPGVVNAARKLLSKRQQDTQQHASQGPVEVTPELVHNLRVELELTAELLKDLAEQHARVVKEVQALRRRQTRLGWVLGLFVVGVATLMLRYFLLA